VIHHDGTRTTADRQEHTDPLTYAYLKAPRSQDRCRSGGNTSFNVAGTDRADRADAIQTLRRSKGLDAVIMIAGGRQRLAAWRRDSAQVRDSGRFLRWLAEWRADVHASPSRRRA